MIAIRFYETSKLKNWMCELAMYVFANSSYTLIATHQQCIEEIDYSK